MATDKSELQQERQALRGQLRRAGWVVAGQQVRVELRQSLAGGPAEGGEPRWVVGTDLTDALRNAVRELGAPQPAADPASPETASE